MTISELILWASRHEAQLTVTIVGNLRERRVDVELRTKSNVVVARQIDQKVVAEAARTDGLSDVLEEMTEQVDTRHKERQDALNKQAKAHRDTKEERIGH